MKKTSSWSFRAGIEGGGGGGGGGEGRCAWSLGRVENDGLKKNNIEVRPLKADEEMRREGRQLVPVDDDD